MVKESKGVDILIVDDEPRMRHILRIILEEAGYSVKEAANGVEALGIISRHPCGVVFTDLKMEGMDGVELLRRIKETNPETPVVVLTAFGSIESAVEAMHEGALDYITKPFEEEKILITAERSLKFYRLAEENRNLKEAISSSFDFSNIVTNSPAMLNVLKEAALVSKSSQTTILLTGESGTGKELLARTIHYNSARRNGKFVAFNCAALSPGLVESELFGHEKGAFTGADRRKIGKFEVANGGTIFLDEIADLSLEAQAKVLRVIQEREFERVGGTESIKVDVRLIAATNQDLKKKVEKGEFREDLYYRINVFPLHLPPLRERKEDIILLAEFFMKRFKNELGRPEAYLTEEAKRILLQQKWPGNVRELENAIERAMILSPNGLIDKNQLSFLSSDKEENIKSGTEIDLTAGGIDLEALEKSLVMKALEITNNNQSAAARLLGLTRSKLRSRLKNLQKS
ncbi:MAG: sigma-54-dependent Fis family transcriptional regulator [Candidatus Aminicenantes bacterium]|nr:MAG: sigma-54-dependent Fis family transcriptional regulator [Candidatus Aminicenantes bacterium]